MKIYKIEILSESGESEGIKYYSNKLDALKAKKENENSMPICEISFKLSKAEVIKLLRIHGSHPDNG